VDEDLAKYFKFLRDTYPRYQSISKNTFTSILDESITILFADHGQHMGPYYRSDPGWLERSLPLLTMVIMIERDRFCYVLR